MLKKRIPIYLINKIQKKKLKPLLVFLIIGVVFLLGVGISTQALMHPNADLNYELLKNVFYPPYFVISGEYYKLDDMLDAQDCKNSSLTPDECPDPLGANVSLIIFVFYALFMPILLVNLLIAIFK